MLSVSGWNIAAVLATTGRNAKKPSAATQTPGRLGKSKRARMSRSAAVNSTNTMFRYWAAWCGSDIPIWRPTQVAAPATA
jgi:hypothetical protein